MNPQTINKIQQLLDRYYNGESTKQEEAELEALLQEAKELPAEMQADAELFREMCGISTLANQQAEEEAMMHLPMGMEERLQATINKLAAPRKSNPWMHLAAACASFIVVIGAAIGYMNIPQDPFIDTCSTPEQAEMQLNRALHLVTTFSQSGLEEARINGAEQAPAKLSANKFISFD